MKISIIICTKNRMKDLINCLRSVLCQSLVPDEIIIIDSSSSKDDIGKLAEFINGINIIKYYFFNTSLTGARNIGVKKSIGDIIIFLDDDTILYNNYIYEIIEIFKSNNNIGFVTGNILHTDMETRTFQNSINNPFIRKIRSIFFSLFLLSKYDNGYFLPSGFPRFPTGKNIMNIECVPGANMAFRRCVLDEFQFDEQLRGYCFMEDCDMSYRVSRKYKGIYTPFAKIIHKVSPISRQNEFNRAKMLIENHFYLFKKNFPQTIKYRLAFFVSILGLFVMAAVRLSLAEFRGTLNGYINILAKENSIIRDLKNP